MKYFISALILAAILLTMNHTKPHTDTLPLTPYDTILAVGDSLTHGYGAAPEQSYPSLLATMSGVNVINEGIDGETSEEGRKRLPQLLQKYHPKLTILCYGGNDILQKRSMSRLKENLKKMITLCRAHSSDVLLIAVPNMTLFGLEPLTLYEEVAEETNTPLVEGLLSEILSSPSLKSDQIHPNAKGYRVMAERIAQEIGY